MGAEPPTTREEAAPGRTVVAGGIPRVAALSAVAVAAALRLPTLGAAFVGDDLELLARVETAGPLAFRDLDVGRNLRPVLDLVLWGQWQAFGTSPLPYHLVSLGLHVLAAVLVARLAASSAARWDLAHPDRIGALGGLVFLLHPSHTETVAWVAGQGALLATVLALAAVVAWFPPPPHRSRRWTAVVLWALAVATYEGAVVVGAVVTVVEARRGGRDGLRRSWPWWAAAGGYLVVRQTVLGTERSSISWSTLVGPDPLRTAGRLGVGLVRSILPGVDAAGPVVAVVVLGVVVAAWRSDGLRGPRAQLVGTLAGAAVVSLVPVAHLGTSLVDTGGERLVYLASALTTIALALVLDAVRPPQLRTAATAALVSVGAVAIVAAGLRWSAAADLSGRLMASAAAFDVDRPVLLLATPDSFGGAVVHRNAEGHDLVVLHGWRFPAPVDAVATYAAGAAGEATTVRWTDTAGRPRLRLHLSHPDARFLEVEGPDGTWDVPGVVGRLVDPRTVEVSFDRPPSTRSGRLVVGTATVWAPDRGRWRPVGPPP